MKQVKILKRPSSTASPTKPAAPASSSITSAPMPLPPSDRVSTELTALLHATLSRERTRLENVQRTRQEALFRAISTVLNATLSKTIQNAAQRETDALITAFAKLNAQAAANASASAPLPPSAQPSTDARDAFAAAFESTSLPAFETAVKHMLANIAVVIESTAEQNVVAPAGDVVRAMARAADDIRSVRGVAADLVATTAALVRAHGVDPDAEHLRLVQAALDAGDVRAALMHAAGKSAAVRAKAVNGVLDSDVAAQDAFGEVLPPRRELVLLAAVLASDLTDRTEHRIGWLYEVVTSMDEAAEFDVSVPGVVEDSKWMLEGVIQKLSEFSKGGGMGALDAKHAKLLIRVLKAHVKAM